MRITEVLEVGSLGTGTGTRSRMDVDLVLFCPGMYAVARRSFNQKE
jgi:hypothetical protein